METSEDNSSLWVVQSGYHHAYRKNCDHLQVVLVEALVQLELKPIFVGEFHSVDSVSHVRVPTLRDFLTKLMLMSIAELVHELLAKDGAAFPSGNEAEYKAFKGQKAGDQ